MATDFLTSGLLRRGFVALVAACGLPLAALSVAATAVAASESAWQLQREEDGIAVFTREMPDSPFLAVKATVSIRQSVDGLAEYLGDGSACMPWRKMCESSQVLRVISERERLVYQVLDLPWPIADRDLVIQSVTDVDPQERVVTVSIETRSDAYPRQKYTRAETSAQIRLRGIDNQTTEFNYIMHADLGGDVSPGLVNARLVEATLEDVQRLVAMAAR